MTFVDYFEVPRDPLCGHVHVVGEQRERLHLVERFDLPDVLDAQRARLEQGDFRRHGNDFRS